LNEATFGYNPVYIYSEWLTIVIASKSPHGVGFITEEHFAAYPGNADILVGTGYYCLDSDSANYSRCRRGRRRSQDGDSDVLAHTCS